jgi:hypothetical protein
MLHSVIETPDFLRDAEKSGLTAEERGKIVSLTAAFPKAGANIPGTGGAWKIRFAGRGKGKSGGDRVIKAERNELRKELSGLAEDYRNGAHRHVQGW